MIYIKLLTSKGGSGAQMDELLWLEMKLVYNDKFVNFYLFIVYKFRKGERKIKKKIGWKKGKMRKGPKTMADAQLISMGSPALWTLTP